MKRVVYKLFFAWQVDAEEQWLTEMSNQGWALAEVGFMRYVFEPCERGVYVYRIELLQKHHLNKESADYIDFLHEAGIECVGGLMRWVYLRKKASRGAFELYSDLSSRIAYNKRVRMFFLFLSGIEFGIGTMNLMIGLEALPHTHGVNLFFALLLYAVAAMLGIAVKKQSEHLRVLQKENSIRE